MTKEETGLRDLLSCTTLVQPSTVAIFQVLQRKTCFCVCMWPITLNVVVGKKPHIYCVDTQILSSTHGQRGDKRLADQRGWEGISCVHPGAWKTSFSTDPEATKHRSQTDRKAPQGTCLHMLFFTHTWPLRGEDRGRALPSLSSLQGELIDGQQHTRSGTQQPWPHSLRTHCRLGPSACTVSYKGNIQRDACLACLHPSNP